MFQYLARQVWFWVGVLALLWVIGINHFPSGYIFIGGDVYQPVNLKEQLSTLHYGWFSGRVTLFYFIFYILQTIGIYPAAQLSWYLGIFLVGAYLSFWLFSRLLFPNIPKVWAMAVSLFYATNLYTLYIFTSSWGYTSYQMLYVFVPILVGLFVKVLTDSRLWQWLAFYVVLAMASASFSNPAFAVSLNLTFLFLSVFLILVGVVSLGRVFFLRLLCILIGAFLMNAYWLLPLVPQAQTGVQEISNSTDIVLSEALRKTSNVIYDTVRLIPTHEQEKYYPENFPYPSIKFIQPIVVLFAFIPFLLACFGLCMRQTKPVRQLQIVFVGLLLIFGMLMMKARFPFETINTFLFELPGFNALRGWDKLAVFTPFFVSVLVLAFFASESINQQAKRRYFTGGVFFVAVLLLALPFFMGGIQTELSYILANSKKKDFQLARQSTLIALPEPYYVAQEIFTADQTESRISMLPYSPGSSIGRVDLPRLKVNGPHPANALYGKRFVELSDYYIGKWIFAKEFERQDIDPEWIIDLYGLLGIKYVFYHHDAKPKVLETFEASRQHLLSNELLKPLLENEWFSLYQTRGDYLFPYVYASHRTLVIQNTPESILEHVGNFRSDIQSVSYQKVRPKELVVSIGEALADQVLYLNERSDTLWKAELVQDDGSGVELTQVDDITFANAWKIPSFKGEAKIVISYLPANLLRMGEWISVTSLLILILVGVWLARKNNQEGLEYVVFKA